MTDHTTNQIDESKLTAYALGELEAHEIEPLERALESDATLRSELESIRATVSMLQGEFGAEPAPTLTEKQRETIQAGPKPVLNEPSIFTGIRGFRGRMIGTGLAAAALIAITATTWMYWEGREAALSSSDLAIEMPQAEPFRSKNGFALNESLSEVDTLTTYAPQELRFDQDRTLDRDQRVSADPSTLGLESTLGVSDFADARKSTSDPLAMMDDESKNELSADVSLYAATVDPDKTNENAGRVADAPASDSKKLDIQRELDERGRRSGEVGGSEGALKPGGTKDLGTEADQDKENLGQPAPATATPPPARDGQPANALEAQRQAGESEIEDLQDRMTSGAGGAIATPPSRGIAGPEAKGGGDGGGGGTTDFYTAQPVGEPIRLEQGFSPIGLTQHSVGAIEDLMALSELTAQEQITLFGEQLPPDFERRNLDERQIERLRRFSFMKRSLGTEDYAPLVDNPWTRPVGEKALSTFSVDVDTASYAIARRYITTNGALPPKDAVRIEEMINYFSYDYRPPSADDDHPFATHIEIADAPWNPEHRLARIGLKGREIAMDKRPSSNLVFLIDVSGSMKPANKLPLLKDSMKMLLEHLNGDDMISIVVYASSSGLVLEPTHCDARESILGAIDNLEAGGSTNGGEGIELAYRLATDHFVSGGVNRVILATDGDFNVGVQQESELLSLIEGKRETGVFLSVLGFGEGNIKDNKMELLADKGNGNYAYIDSIREAQKVLVDQATGTLVTIAKDVKLQVEFNPAKVGAYRLIGYANRLLEAKDFNNDKKDAGEIGAGHSVTALYQIVPPGVALDGDVDELKYQKPEDEALDLEEGLEIVESDELFTLKLRYKQPDADESSLIEIPVVDEGGFLEGASSDFHFASAVAAFGMILRDSEHRGDADCELVLELALAGSGEERIWHEAFGFLEDFTHYALTANVDLAIANAQALLESGLSDNELALIMMRSSLDKGRFDRAIERASMVPRLGEVAKELDRHLADGRKGLARARMDRRKTTYRGEFIELVRQAQQLGAR